MDSSPGAIIEAIRSKERLKLLLVMRIYGETLEKHTEEKEHLQTFSLRDIWVLIVQLFVRVAEIHASGLVHLDLKPSNVVIYRDDNLRRDWILRLIDLGMAQAVGEAEDFDSLNCFKGDYAPPEKEETTSSDIYAAGLIAMRLLYNVDVCTWNNEKKKIKETPAEWLDDKTVTTGLVKLFCSCLDSDPSVRPTACKVLDALAKEWPTKQSTAQFLYFLVNSRTVSYRDFSALKSEVEALRPLKSDVSALKFEVEALKLSQTPKSEIEALRSEIAALKLAQTSKSEIEKIVASSVSVHIPTQNKSLEALKGKEN